MSEGKRQVLEMLEQGKITQEDAARLLDALGETGEEPPAPQEGGNGESGGEQPENALAPVEAPSAPGGEKVKQPEGNLSRTVRDIVSGAVDMAKQAVKEARIMLDGVEISYPVTGSDDLVINMEPPTPPTSPTPPAPPEPPAPPAAEEPGEYNCRSEGTFLTGPVSSLRISWLCGPVEIRPWGGDSPRITEYSSRPLAEEERLWFSYDDGEMKIRWTKDSVDGKEGWPSVTSGIKRWFSGVSLGLSKRLVVELPQSTDCLEILKIGSAAGAVTVADLPMALEDVRIDTASGAVTLLNLHGETVHGNTASGAISVRSLVGEEVELHTASGSIELENLTPETLKASSASGAVAARNICGDTLVVSSVSGRLTAENIVGEDVKLSTVSGALRAVGKGESVKANTVSGALEMQMAEMPEDIVLSTVSGAVDLTLPENTGDGFTVNYQTHSGSFESEFPLSGKLDKKSGDACFGDGETEIHITTMSGGIRILKA